MAELSDLEYHPLERSACSGLQVSVVEKRLRDELVFPHYQGRPSLKRKLQVVWDAGYNHERPSDLPHPINLLRLSQKAGGLILCLAKKKKSINSVFISLLSI